MCRPNYGKNSQRCANACNVPSSSSIQHVATPTGGRMLRLYRDFSDGIEFGLLLHQSTPEVESLW